MDIKKEKDKEFYSEIDKKVMFGNNKYYTPEIEEFHVGFEYELHETIPDDNGCILYSKKKEWQYRVLTIGHMCQPLNYDFFINNSDRLRVKYLDKEDIESLGWKGQEANSVYFKKDNYRLVHWLANNEIGRDISIYESYDGGSQEEALVRKAIIKNKSELKKLLKQLNIE